MAFAIFGLYMWFAFLSPNQSPHDIHLVTVLVAGACAAASILARVLVDTKGAFIRSLISYLLLVTSVVLLLYDTDGVNSPYIFMWTLTAAFAGLFGIWSSAPVFLVASSYIAILFLQNTIDQQDAVPTILIIAVPIIFSIIVWSHVRQVSHLKKERDPVAYKQLSTELSNLANESEVVINAIGDGVLAIDSQGIVQLINPAAQSILGWSRSDALTLQYQSILKLSSEDDKPLADTAEPIIQALNTNQEIRSNRLKMETKSGKKIFVSLVASPLGSAGSGVIAVFRDVTKERAEEREQAEFISTASHEMRTPVASIEGYLGLALNPATATIDDKARDFIQKAHESAQHLGRLFQDLLDVSKAEDGRLSNNPVVIDIVDFAGDVIEGLQQKASDKGLQLTYKPAPNATDKGERRLSPVFYVNLDKDHIREIVNNLTENAIKYTPAGEVSVDIHGDDEHVTISVTDSGIGIPAEDLSHLFQKFYRVDNTDTREIGGTGLGLYLCRRLAETLGGRIWAESTYKKGSTFYVELPRIDTQQAQRLKNTQAAAQQKPQPVAAPLIQQPEAPVTAPIQQEAKVTPPEPTLMQPVTSETTPPPPQTVAPVAQVITPVEIPPEPAPITAPTPIPQPIQPTNSRVNTPLSSIEQNPIAFTQPRDGTVSIPVRNQSNQ